MKTHVVPLDDPPTIRDGVRVDVDSSADVVARGASVTITTEVVIREGEAIPIDGIELHLEGNRTSTVTFGADGVLWTDRPWVGSVERTFENSTFAIRPSQYGYDERTDRNVSFGGGRGYGDNAALRPASLRYTITLDTGALPPGEYSVVTRVIASSDTAAHTYASDPVPLTIQLDRASPATTAAAGATPVEEPGFGALDVTIVLVVLLILFGAGYYGVVPVYEWYRNR